MEKSVREKRWAYVALFAIVTFVVSAVSAVESFASWCLTFEDDTQLAAPQFRGSECAVTNAAGARVRTWESADLTVRVTEEPPVRGACDVSIAVENRGVKAVTACAFPARLRFKPEEVVRFVYPGRGNFGVGMAFNQKFFQPTGNKKRPYYSYRVKYPTLFADFAFLEKTNGETLAIYGLQPRTGVVPWQNKTPFNPGETAVGGDAQGGWYEHSFALWAKCGARWTSPRLRVAAGLTLEDALADYAEANAYTKTLAQKVSDSMRLAALKRAPLVLLGGAVTAHDLPEFGAKLPVPTLMHVTSYLHGGFDKQYPDHLPPCAAFGTQAAFAAAVQALQRQGHLVCPYTNPTWWCDDPPGPTFAKWGKGALSIDRKGEYRHETYAGNPGWQQCYFHPGSHEGNRRTVRQFTEEIPVDLLFEDQVGGRDWVWDFNPCSPCPTAHSEGMLSLAAEHAARVPVGCEDGWDQLANCETALMGCTWKIVPLTRMASALPLFRETFPADTWTIEPVSLRLFHDKCLFYMHDLGSFCYSDLEVAWMLALGFQLSWKLENASIYRGAVADWYAYLHTLQREIVSQMAGAPLVAFHHDRAPLIARGGNLARRADDGVVTAQYGAVKVFVNLGDVPRTIGGKRLAPYGYWVDTPRGYAGWLEGEGAKIVVDGKAWRRVPQPLGGAVVPPPPQGGARKVGVIWMGAAMPRFGATLSGEDWLAALPGSVRIATPEDLQRALEDGPSAWRAIVNAHGECFPETMQGAWSDTLQCVLRYVRAGGHWFETAGAPLNSAFWRDAQGVWQREGLHGSALGTFGIALNTFDPVGKGRTPRMHALRCGAAGSWLPEDIRAMMRMPRHRLDRAVGGSAGNAVFSVIENAQGMCWFGATREGGRGALWRIGTLAPDPLLSKAVVAATVARLEKHELPPVPDVLEYRFEQISNE